MDRSTLVDVVAIVVAFVLFAQGVYNVVGENVLVAVLEAVLAVLVLAVAYSL